MALRDIQIASTEVKTPGGSFSVRGLAFADIVVVANSHGPAASMVFAKAASGGTLADEDIRTVIAGIAPQVPDLVAALIALAADDYCPETIEIVKKLNFQYQLEALEAIFKNTFQSEAEIKKFVESIIRMLGGATKIIQQMRLPLSELGFGE